MARLPSRCIPMLKRSYFALIIIAAVFAIGCGVRSDDTTPDMAQRLLKLRGYFFTQEGFFKAIRLRDGKAVKAFLQGGMDPNTRNVEGQTALTFALQFTDATMIEPLMKNADLSMIDGEGNSPVYLALKHDHKDIFERLYEKGVDVNSRGRDGIVGNQTLLMLAVQKRDKDMVSRLLEDGADPNLTDERGDVALFAAVTRATVNTEILDLLIARGADVNKTSEARGRSTLLYAAANYAMAPETRLQVIQTLLEKGANVNQQEKENGYSALHYTAIDYRTPHEARSMQMKLLLDHGADRTLKTLEGQTVLDWVKETEDTQLASILK